ncbi:MAG: hypothetical protein ACJATA_000830 [Sphingobacteriales bacterium]|jgi:hypothetical protein
MKSLLSLISPVQETIEMADIMRSSGKIYVVVSVVLIVFTLLIIYLVKLDNRISKIEKNQN